MATETKTRLGVWKLTSCDGCQLQLLNLETQFLTLAETFTFAYFPEGFRDTVRNRYDLSLVEGSVTTSEDERRIRRIRQQSRIVVAMGACATAGGLQALRNFGDLRQWLAIVYPRPDVIGSLPRSTPLSDHIHVDAELRGCPINGDQLLAVMLACHRGRIPRLPTHSLCISCKRLGHVCVTVTRGIPCMGPVTQTGCGALCPAVGRGCYGCFGPSDTANTEALRQIWRHRLKLSADGVKNLFRGSNAWAEPFRRESERP